MGWEDKLISEVNLNMDYEDPIWKQEHFTMGLTGANRMYFLDLKDEIPTWDGTPPSPHHI